MKTRILIFSILLFVILIIPKGSFATEIETGIKLNITEDGVAEVTYVKPEEPEAVVIIPGEIDGHKITRIADSAFEGNTDIETVIIPDTITEIGKSAFQYSSIEYISIPNSVTTLRESAFDSCKNLKSVIIPSSVTFMDIKVFYYCNNLQEVVILDGVQDIQNSVFYNCNNLKDITIPKSVTDINDMNFNYTENLTIHAPADSCAAIFAESKNINCDEYDIPISKCTVEGLKNENYTGKPIELNINLKYKDMILEKEKDYTIEYKNNTNVGTATIIITGKGKYIENTNKTFKILMKNLSEVTATVDTSNKTYTGKALTTSITLKDGNTTLRNGTDYIVNYKNNVNAGTATITIEGKGNYTGIITKTFKIVGKNLSKVTVTVDTSNKTYTGKALTTSITLKDGNTTLKNGTDYTVSYKNNTNVGTATVTITGKGNYVGSISKTFKIVEKPATQPDTGTTTKYKLGDVNNDGKINTKDAREVLLAYIGKKTLTADQKQAADVNKDGKINTRDARQILLYYIGKVSKF